MNNQSNTPLLDSINTPADLRRLNVEELPMVCQEIRKYLINSLADNPGHFASSMGAVDLIVALHYVFDTPYDRIVWDVGHQAYAHKLLTGRRERFADNRKMGGLSGFPTPLESEYDTFMAGHASNSISAALGMAVATRLNPDEPARRVAAVIGDASISGGLAFEGLNNAANVPNNLLIVLNDNDMSIDDNVGALHDYLSTLNTGNCYNRMRRGLYRLLRRWHLISENKRGRLTRFNNSIKSLLTGEQNIFEGLNIRYFGPFDGHDVVKLVRTLNNIKDIEGPKILHLRTVKGKGFAPAEQDPANWHAPGRFDVATGVRDAVSKPSSSKKYQDIFGEQLLELARQNDKIVGITAAMPSGTSIAVMQEAMPDRVFDTGISEGHAVTFAGGLAKDGFRPVVAIYSSFLQRAYDNIIHDVAIARLPVVFAIDRAGLVGEDGVTHHGQFDLAYLRAVPNLTVSAPSDGRMLRELLTLATTQTDGPMAIRYPRGNAHADIDGDGERQPPVIGQSRTLRIGTDGVILSIGTMLDASLKAADLLADQGINVTVVDMIFLKPLDTKTLSTIVTDNAPIVTVEDGTLNGGLGSAVAEWLTDNGMHNALARVGIADKFVHQGTPAQLHELCGLTPENIAAQFKMLRSLRV